MKPFSSGWFAAVSVVVFTTYASATGLYAGVMRTPRVDPDDPATWGPELAFSALVVLVLCAFAIVWLLNVPAEDTTAPDGSNEN